MRCFFIFFLSGPEPLFFLLGIAFWGACGGSRGGAGVRYPTGGRAWGASWPFPHSMPTDFFGLVWLGYDGIVMTYECCTDMTIVLEWEGVGEEDEIW